MSKPKLYKFDNVFSYYPETDIIMPKFDVLINDKISRANVPIRNNDGALYNHGLDLFRYITKDFAGVWDKKSEMLTITGVYS